MVARAVFPSKCLNVLAPSAKMPLGSAFLSASDSALSNPFPLLLITATKPSRCYPHMFWGPATSALLNQSCLSSICKVSSDQSSSFPGHGSWLRRCVFALLMDGRLKLSSRFESYPDIMLNDWCKDWPWGFSFQTRKLLIYSWLQRWYRSNHLPIFHPSLCHWHLHRPLVHCFTTLLCRRWICLPPQFSGSVA